MNKIEQFKIELKALLKKYDASIFFDCSPCSDTYGLYDEKIVIHINHKDTTLAKGWGVNAEDL